MDTTKRSPLDRLLFATFLKGRTSSRDIWEEKGDMTPEDNQKIIEETNEIINDVCILVGALAVPGAANPELLPVVITISQERFKCSWGLREKRG